jgi:hypothetical protein
MRLWVNLFSFMSFLGVALRERDGHNAQTATLPFAGGSHVDCSVLN